MDTVAKALLGIFLNGLQYLFRVCLKLVDRHGIRGVVRKGYHGLLAGEVHGYHRIVICHCTGPELLVSLRTVMHLEVLFYLLIGDPNGAEAGGFGGHDIDAVTEVYGQFLYAGTCELKHLVLYETAFEGSLDKGDSHIMRADAPLGLTLEPYQHHLGCLDVPGVLQELLHEFTAAFAHAHVAK